MGTPRDSSKNKNIFSIGNVVGNREAIEAEKTDFEHPRRGKEKEKEKEKGGKKREKKKGGKKGGKEGPKGFTPREEKS